MANSPVTAPRLRPPPHSRIGGRLDPIQCARARHSLGSMSLRIHPSALDFTAAKRPLSPGMVAGVSPSGLPFSADRNEIVKRLRALRLFMLIVRAVGPRVSRAMARFTSNNPPPPGTPRPAPPPAS
jgi:hypothetical protein